MSRGMSLSEAEYRALLARRGQAPSSRPHPPALSSLVQQHPEAAFYAVLQEVGHVHGWMAECSWMPHGEDQGLCCWLLRPPEVLYALIRGPERALTPMQQRWVAALKKTRIEVVEWRCDEIETMTERLARKAQPGVRASKARLGVSTLTIEVAGEQL